MGALDVCVVGSANLDITMPVDALPQSGETILGGAAVRAIGGKGLNQAIACARLDRRTALLACVGADEAADAVRAAMIEAGVATDLLVHHPHAPTGLAFVLVAPQDNAIVVSPGANSLLTPADIRAATGVIAAAGAVLAQLEIPMDSVRAAAAACTGLFLLNPAPARPLPRTLLQRVDVLVPNASELATLTGRPEPRSVQDAVTLARALSPHRRLVVTMGSGGAVVIDGAIHEHVPTVPVEVVDPTAAGDTFCAALADALLDGAELADAARWTCRAAALTVRRRGAADAVPTRAEVLAAE